MGGTGGPGSDQTQSQQGLIGAGLLAGNADEQAAKAAALGVENAAQPTSSQLMGTGAGTGAPIAVSAASPAAPAVTPAATGPPTINFGTPGTTTAEGPKNPAFALAGQGNLGFPTGVTDDMPLGAYTHVPFGTQLGDATTTGDAVTGPAIAGDAGAKDTGEHPVYGPGIVSGNYGDWGSGSKYGDWFYDFYFSKQHPDGSWWSPNDKTGLTPSHPLGGTGYEFKDPDWFSKNLPKKA